MSSILWKSILIPELSMVATDHIDESYKERVERVKKIALNSSEISIPDPRAFRSMSRASIFVSHICQFLKPELSGATLTDFNMGIYCAVENGPIDGPTTAQLLGASSEDFPEAYRKLRNPKMYLKQLPNLVPAQLGISLGLHGPMNVYTHSKMASLHALDQAELDLNLGVIDYALVCAAHAFDDFLVVKRTRIQDERILVEGAAAVVLKKGSGCEDWSTQIQHDPEHYFGIADQIVSLVRSL